MQPLPNPRELFNCSVSPSSDLPESILLVNSTVIGTFQSPKTGSSINSMPTVFQVQNGDCLAHPIVNHPPDQDLQEVCSTLVKTFSIKSEINTPQGLVVSRVRSNRSNKLGSILSSPIILSDEEPINNNVLSQAIDITAPLRAVDEPIIPIPGVVVDPIEVSPPLDQVSMEISQRVANPQRKSTSVQYKAKMQRFFRWCHEHQVSVTHPSIDSILKFFHFL